MSILMAARRQAGRPRSAFEASMGLGIEAGARRGRQWLGWLLGMPLCALLGAGANYGWHWWHNQPLEQRIEVTEATPLPYRPSANQHEFVTEPLPPPKVVEAPKPAPAVSKPQLDLDGVSPSLAQRFQQALAAGEPAGPGSETEPAEVPAGEAVPLAALPADISRQVPPLQYRAHVYSSTGGNSTINLNGKDYHEGDEVLPGLVLLRILPQASILRTGAQSFSLAALSDWHGPTP